MKGSFRTSALGVLTIVAAIAGALKALLDGDPATVVDVPTVVAAVMAGFGLLNARDDKVTSESAGAK